MGKRQEAVEKEVVDDGSGKWLAQKGRRAQDSEGEVESPLALCGLAASQ